MTRYAVYFAPARGTPWWSFGAHWLGRDEQLGHPLEQPGLPSMDAGAFAGLTAEPRRYGFHATLKAPFRLASGVDKKLLLQRLTALAGKLDPVPLELLVPVFMDGFVALVPSNPNPALNALAAACVTELDDLRAPLTESEHARRHIAPSDQRGLELLEKYGYPGVMERFRFHMTLTGKVDTALAGQVVAQVAAKVARLNAVAPPLVDRLCLFVEPEPAAAFRRVADVEVGA